MRKNRDARSPIRRWVARLKLTVDSGIIVLVLLALATALLFGLRLVRHSNSSAPTAWAKGVGADGQQGAISGITRIVDGDTLEVAGTKIRLFGIDAPEHGQICHDAANTGYDCGARASAQMESLIAGQAVSCLPRTTDRYGRTVAVCSVAGHDLGREIVSSGWAVAFERYSRDYVGDETQARGQRLGLWQGSFERPSNYRADQRTPH